MKYNIDKRFGILKYFKSPMNKISFIVGNFFISIIPKWLKTKYTKFNKIKLHDFSLYIIEPKNSISNGTLMFFHGGAFCYKGNDTYFKHIKRYIKETNISIVYVDYNMAYKSTDEVCANNCFSAYKYIINNYKKLNLDISNIGFLGDSAGGYISLRVISLINKYQLPLPKYQILIYPVVSKNKDFDSLIKFRDTPVWDSNLNKKMWKFYANDKFYFDPLVENISYMPKTYIEVCEFDPLHDEGIALYKRLISYNINVLLNETFSTIHGYDIYMNHPIVLNSFDKRINFIKNNIKEKEVS